MAKDETISNALTSLERIQTFDVDSLRRKEDLGGRLNFDEAIAPASRVVDLFQRISPSSIQHFPDAQATQVRNQADGAYALFAKMLEFDPTVENAGEQRKALLNQLNELPESVSSALWNHISFSVATSLDPTATQQEIRSNLQQFKDERVKSLGEIGGIREEINEVLDRVRTAAAEQGVSQQASYFKTIAEEHATDAEKWMWRSLWAGVITLVFALISAFSYRIPWVSPDDPIEAVQLVTSKIFILALLSYGLFTCVKNFLSHKHNSVVNRHRQNALLTYTAFVDAAPSSASREIVLTHAAASVFAPQETGYVKQDEAGGGRSVMEMITRASMGEGRPAA